MSTVLGYIEKIIYRNENNGYTVLSVESDDDEYVLVGTFNYIAEGEFIKANGNMKLHPSYGEQLFVDEYEIVEPRELDSIQKYLASSAIKGVGEALAKRIVKKFKMDTLRVMEEEPERLAEVKGVSAKLAKSISEQIQEKKSMRDAMIFLQKFGISMKLAAKIYMEYGSKIYTIIETNPYKLADDIEGIGFKIADDIAKKVGITADSKFRAIAGVEYLLSNAMLSGHLYLPDRVLEEEFLNLFGENIFDFNSLLSEMQMEKRIVVKRSEETNVYLSGSYYTELAVAKMLIDINIKAKYDISKIEDKIRKIEDKEGIILDDLQRQAVIESINSGLIIITGGPGTGKTTTINTIIKYFESEGESISLAAPTGRAAKRMSEATSYEAKTIHRLLEITPNISENSNSIGTHFERNEDNPLEADVLIIDEVSMVDIFLMNALLKAVAIGTRLILVGDINQLPSVGPGTVLKDLIESNCFNVVRLNKIYRQSVRSDIVVNAHKIMTNEDIDLSKKSNDFIFIKQNNPEHVMDSVITLMRDKLPGYVNSTINELQVMTPMRKGPLGVEVLNSFLQNKLNPTSKQKNEKEYDATVFREGDKVMQIKNNYQKEWYIYNEKHFPVDKGLGVYNGDIGVIKEIDMFSESFTICFDDGKVSKYEFSEFNEIELAYAITVHKSQGSEYPAVIIPIYKGPAMLMNRNLIYTAITRAKRCVVLVGVPEAFYTMIQNTKEMARYTGLKSRILELDILSKED
ncbi:RecD/TraA family helicase [Lachnospiraceae oral taxon 107 str. F0167]|nr:RecD/TraA family helicase [Lachnospiraceae oral taxon 107 str. F0167]